MKDETFHRLLRELKPFLRSYLEEHNVEIDERGFMCCVNPDHHDKTPSMHFVPGTDETLLHCFGCGASYNIFHTARAMENMEDRGTGFIKETIPTIAKKYKVEFDSTDLELSEEAVVLYRYRQLYRDAYEVLKDIGVFEHTEKRGWNDKLCKKLGIASVDWDKFSKRLQNRGGYEEEELASKGITRKLFSHHLITFGIMDHKGRPSGFVARNVNYSKTNKATYPKYRNTSSDVPIYNKSKILYGLQSATSHPERRLDIFEGYADWVTAQQHDHPCCAAMGGVSLTLEHLQTIKEIGFSHINLIFDGDETGEKKTGSYLDRYAGKVEGLRITVMELPFEDSEFQEAGDKDPDNFFKLKGLEGFMTIEPMTAFDWRLRRGLKEIRERYLDSGIELDELKENFLRIAEDDLKTLVDSMISMIMAELSPIEQGRMCTRLSRVTGVPEPDIRDEVSTRSNRQVKDIGEFIQRKLKSAGDAIEVQEILAEGARRVSEVTASRDLSAYHHLEVLDHLDTFYNECDHPRDEISGWRTGWAMFDDPVVMGGVPKKDSIITLAGSPNHGKSALLMNLAKQLIINDNPGMSVMMWYLDDPRNIAWAKMLASMCCESILDVRRPERRIYEDKERKARFLQWRDFLRHCVNSKRLLVKGHDIGNDVGSLEYWIKHTQDSTGNDVVVFVDAVHDMITGKGSTDNDERIKFARIYDWVQATSETMKYTFLTCAHITKSGMAKGKPDQHDLSETGKIIFASKIIGMVYSELDYLTSVHRRDEALMYWKDEREVDNIDRKKPIVEMNVTKNKEAQFKGTMYFKHKSDACYMQPMSTAEVELTVNMNKEASNDDLSDEKKEKSRINTSDTRRSIKSDDLIIESLDKSIKNPQATEIDTIESSTL